MRKERRHAEGTGLAPSGAAPDRVGADGTRFGISTEVALRLCTIQQLLERIAYQTYSGPLSFDEYRQEVLYGTIDE